MSNALDVVGLTGGYRGTAVVIDVRMTLARGEIVVLLGSNGAGKTTTLLTISGVLDAFAGDVRLDGRSIAGRRPSRSRARA